MDLTLIDFVSNAWARKFLILLLTGLSLIASSLSFRFIPKVYQADALVLVGQDKETNSTLRQAEIVNTKLYIASSDEVISNAMSSLPAQEWSGTGFDEESRENILVRLRSALSISVEPNSDIVKISFRSKSPQFSRDFCSALAKSFVSRDLAIVSKPGQAAFFGKKRQEFEQDLIQKSDNLIKFEQKNRIYSVDEQRELQLRRQSDLQAAVDATSGKLKDKEAQVLALANQLNRLKPVLNSPYVSALIGETIQSIKKDQKEQVQEKMPALGTEPPLLLVKVYQTSIETLVASYAELAGLRALMASQRSALQSMDDELLRTSQSETTMAYLIRDKENAVKSIELYSKNYRESMLEAEMNAAKFSNVLVVQDAVLPLRPSSPKKKLILLAALFVGLLFGAILANIMPRRPQKV